MDNSALGIYHAFTQFLADGSRNLEVFIVSTASRNHQSCTGLSCSSLPFNFHFSSIFNRFFLAKTLSLQLFALQLLLPSRVERNGFKIEWMLLAQNAKTSTDGDGRMMVGKASITSKNSSWVKERNLKNRTTAREKDPKPTGNETVLRD